mmetsp:Transcript_40820/g.92738  ORF Transcript_40820/g.92738 Transcript_40820/m.92738 type:complete len:93 (+) Transcript_40820:372-650(+)
MLEGDWAIYGNVDGNRCTVGAARECGQVSSCDCTWPVGVKAVATVVACFEDGHTWVFSLRQHTPQMSPPCGVDVQKVRSATAPPNFDDADLD